MQFLHPQFLWLLLLGLIPLLLYLFRRKAKTVRVSTIVFFKTLAKEHQESAWIRRLKKWISFALTVAMLVLAALALSRLANAPGSTDFRTVVVLLDRSASMSVKDEEGVSRLDEARTRIKDRLASIPEEVGVALVSYDSRPEVLQPRSLDRREFLSRLDQVKVRPIADSDGSAWEAAGLIAGLETPAVIWHVSDGGEEKVPPPGTLPEEVKVDSIGVALAEAPNVGIVGFQVRPVPLEHSRYEVYVQLALGSAAKEAVVAKLSVSVGGIPSQIREVDLEPADRAGFTFRVDGVGDQMLRLSVSMEGDVFPLDDEVNVPLPRPRPILAAWIRPDESEDPYTRFALAAIQETGSFELLKGNPGSWPLSEKVDAVVFDGWLPEEWPSDLPAVVIDPPGGAGPVAFRRLQNPVPYDSIRVGNEEHPVLFRISSGRVALTQTALFQSAGSLEPLWLAGNEPVLAAGEVDGRRIVVMGFSPGRSERLPLTASFPLLMGNALYWVVDRDREGFGVDLLRTGEFADIGGDSIEWTSVDESGARTRRLPLESGVAEMDRIGAWRTEEGKVGAAHLLSASESDLPVRQVLAASPEQIGEDVVSRWANWGKLWLLVALVLVVLAESFLFHRRAVY